VTVTAIPRSKDAAKDVPVRDSNQLRHNWRLSKREPTTGPSVSFVKIREGKAEGMCKVTVLS